MEISEIEDNTIELGFVIDTLKYILDRFEERLYEEYCILLSNKNEKQYYYELRSNLLLLTKIAESFNEIKNRLDRQIDMYYAHL